MDATMPRLPQLLSEIRACTLCAHELEPRPVVQASASARLLIAGQAPGSRVHATGVPFDDPSGDRLRDWMGVDRDTFYNARRVAIVPMAFCFPGNGKTGDLPPPPRCSETWHGQLRPKLKKVGLTLVIGQYAQAYWFGDRAKRTLTETVEAWRDFAPDFLPMPHPSPRNNRWLRNNPWFEDEVVPALQKRVKKLLAAD